VYLAYTTSDLFVDMHVYIHGFLSLYTYLCNVRAPVPVILQTTASVVKATPVPVTLLPSCDKAIPSECISDILLF
jgi:hypothetical protein